MAAKETLRTLRGILSELRKYLAKDCKLRENPQAKYILSLYRINQVTDQQYCKAQEESKYIASTYLSYLRSKRLYSNILLQYHSKRENTIQETASQLGFKLPHDPK